MAQTIARLYRSRDTAMAAVDALKERGFSDESIHVVAPPEASKAASGGSGESGDPASTATDLVATPADPIPPSDDQIPKSILAAGVSPSQVPIYAEGVRRGEVLVVVHPLFGYAHTATAILDSFDPVAVALPEAEPAAVGAWDNAAPLSSALGMRVLSSDPTPLSTWLKWPTLKPEPGPSPVLAGIRKKSGDAAPLSNKLGMPVLSPKAAPLSARFGWRVLLDNPTPLSTWRNWRVLSDNPTPLSTWRGWRLLSENATPLSSFLGWKVLSKKD